MVQIFSLFVSSTNIVLITEHYRWIGTQGRIWWPYLPSIF